METFWDIFEDSESYPQDMAERGVPLDTLFEYVSSTFLNGFINYVEDPKVYLIERYGKFNDNKKTHVRDGDEITIAEYLDHLEQFSHSRYKDALDDIVILAHTPKSYWFFYSDRDCSDCSIGRVSRDKMVNFRSWIWLFENCFKPYDNPVKFIELPKPTGWITL